MRLLAALFLVVSASTSYAQTSGTIVPTYKLTNFPPRSPTEIHNSWSGGVNVIAWWLNGFGQQATREKIRKAIEASIVAQRPFLEWTGQGVLLNARAITTSAPNTPLRAWAVVGDGAAVIGHGRSPEEALLSSWRRGALSAGVPDGWAVDEALSVYIWVSKKPDGALATEGVPRGTMLDLNKRVRDNWAEINLRMLEGQIDNATTWEQVAKTAKARIASRESRAAIDRTLNEVVESQKRVREINKRLAAELERARAAGETARTVSILQGVLTVAQLSQMAVDALNVSPSDFSGVSTAEGVVKKVESIRDGRIQYAAQMKVEFDGGVKDLQKFLDTLYGQIQPAKPPSPVRDSLTLTNP